jgi:flagellar assembly protein FliH
MADLSLLMGRGNGRFAADARFDAADDETEAPLAPATDPLAEAHAAGFAEGVAAAHAQALADIAAEQGVRERLGFSFARLDAELAEALRQRLLDTVVALCEATLAPLTLDVPALARRVERATALFARADDERVIRLHPEDLAAVQPLLPADWTFTPDPALERGALRVETVSGGAEDGPEQWRRAIAEALDLC